MAHRIERLNEDIKMYLSQFIERGLNDPRLKDFVLSITKVKTTPDMKYAKVYVSVYAGKEKQKQALETLDKAKGYLRKQLSGALTSRRAPEIVFELDDSVDNFMYIEQLIKETKGNNKW